MIDHSANPELMPAFPLHNGDVWGGMTLRDYFAAKAMQSLILNGATVSADVPITARAYELADAMLRAREQ